MKEVQRIVPMMVTGAKEKIGPDMNDIKSWIAEGTKRIRDEAKIDREKTNKLYDSMNKWMADTTGRSKDTRRELDNVRELAKINHNEQNEVINELTKSIERLEQRADESQNAFHQKIEARLAYERKSQDERFERLIMMQSARTQEDIKRISLESSAVLAKYTAETRATIKNETQKVSRQVAQTALDLDGIKHKLNTIDMDLQATGEVAASASGYLARATNDYKAPESVEYETIVSPEATPSRSRVNNNTTTTESPLFGGAQMK